MFGTIRREATDPSAHRNAWSGAQQQQQQQQQHQQQQHQQPPSQQNQQQQHLQHPLPHHSQQHHLHQPQQQHQHHILHNQQPDQPAQRGRGGTSNMTVVSSGGGGSAAATARAARSSPMVQMAIDALVSFNKGYELSSEMLSFHEDILDAAARAWDAGYHWSISIFAVALRAIIRDVAAERRHKFGSTLDPAYVEKVTCAIQTRFLTVDPALGILSSASTSTPPASSAVPSAATLAAATHVSPQQAPHLTYHDVQATAAAALAANPLSAPSINVKASSSPSPALSSSSVLVPPAVRVIQPPPSPHHGHTPPPGPGQPHPNKLPAIQPQPPIQPRPQQLPSQQQAILPLPRPHRQPLPQGPPSQPQDQDQDQTDPPGSPPAKRRRPLPTVGVHSWAVVNGNSNSNSNNNSNAGAGKSTSASPPRSKATSGNLAPPEEETISAKRRRRRSDRGGDPGAYRNVGGYGDVTASGYGYGYTGTVKCTMPPCEWTAVTTSMRMGLRLNDHLLRKHGVENSAIRLRPSYIRRMPRSHAAVRVVKERGPYRSAREALIRIADNLSASIKDWRCPSAIGKLREERAREVFPHTDDVKSMSGKDLREELVRMRTGDGMQIAAAAMAAENTRLGVANHKDSPLEVWTREQFVPWQASVKEVDPAALAASESAQLGTKSPETMNRWLENHFRPWESKDGGGEEDDGSTIVAAGTAPRGDDEEDDSKGEGEDGPSDEDRSDDDDENDA